MDGTKLLVLEALDHHNKQIENNVKSRTVFCSMHWLKLIFNKKPVTHCYRFCLRDIYYHVNRCYANDSNGVQRTNPMCKSVIVSFTFFI